MEWLEVEMHVATYVAMLKNHRVKTLLEDDVVKMDRGFHAGI